MPPEDLIARLLFRDGLMLVIDKPYGIAVHRGPKGGNCLEDQFSTLRFGLPRSPSLAHRLDRETTGCLVLGRHRKALARLGSLFKNGRVKKTYWAIVHNTPPQPQGLIDLPLGRLDDSRGWWMKIDPNGASAQTRWTLLASAAGRSWLALEPLTGRTHQLRVHCAAMGWPIVGDAIYGMAGPAGFQRLQLHAREIVIPLYQNKPAISVIAPLPNHMGDALTAIAAPNIAAPLNRS
jgi:tRNA pseudouridine32 synthase / 23S rRNA pseudouridine746 synthase